MKNFAWLFDPFLGLMALVIAIATLVPVHGQGAAIAGYVSDAGIFILFFLYGTRLSSQAALEGLLQWRLQLAVLLSTFALFPILGLGLVHVFPSRFSPTLLTGFLFLCVLPSTVQSSIAFTSIARGNVAAALCAASASNILGVFVSPLLAGLILHAQGVSFSWTVFRDIAMQLMLPFALGQLLRPVVGERIQRNRKVIGFFDRGVILLIIYVAFSKGVVDGIWLQLQALDLVVLIAILAILLLTVLVVTHFVGSRLMGLSREDSIALQFCGSKKSLASGLPMSTMIFSVAQQSMIILPLILFHQIQLIVCAILARHYREKSPPA